MNKKEYQEYQDTVSGFFTREGIDSLSLACSGDAEAGVQECPGCLDECSMESFFSHSPCDCCQRPLGGDRYHVTAFNQEHRIIVCYDVCPDCYYYAEYGQLDDQTMMEIEK